MSPLLISVLISIHFNCIGKHVFAFNIFVSAISIQYIRYVYSVPHIYSYIFCDFNLNIAKSTSRYLSEV